MATMRIFYQSPLELYFRTSLYPRETLLEKLTGRGVTRSVCLPLCPFVVQTSVNPFCCNRRKIESLLVSFSSTSRPLRNRRAVHARTSLQILIFAPSFISMYLPVFSPCLTGLCSRIRHSPCSIPCLSAGPFVTVYLCQRRSSSLLYPIPVYHLPVPLIALIRINTRSTI